MRRLSVETRANGGNSTVSRTFESELAPLRAAGIEVHHLGSRVLAEGDCAPEVCALQAMLLSEKLLTLPSGGLPTGYFGPSTTEALKRWQRGRGIEPTGVFGDAAREAYLAQKKSKLFESIFSPTPPNREWMAAEKFGAPVRSKGGWSKEAYLSGADVFIASFVSGVAFTLAIFFQHSARRRWMELKEEDREIGKMRTRRELSKTLIYEYIGHVFGLIPNVILWFRDRIACVLWRKRHAARIIRGHLRTLQTRDDDAPGVFALRIGNFRIGSW